MRYTARVGFLGYTPREIRSMASAGRSAAIYNGLVYDVVDYLMSPPLFDHQLVHRLLPQTPISCLATF